MLSLAVILYVFLFFNRKFVNKVSEKIFIKIFFAHSWVKIYDTHNIIQFFCVDNFRCADVQFQMCKEDFNENLLRNLVHKLSIEKNKNTYNITAKPSIFYNIHIEKLKT